MEKDRRYFVSYLFNPDTNTNDLSAGRISYTVQKG